VPARCCLLLLFAVAGLWLSFPSFSQAAGADDLLGCSSLQKAIEREDGSIVAIGSTDGCNRNLAPPGWAFLVAVSPDGKLLPGFGNGGLVGVPNGADSLLLGRPDGGVIVRSGEALVSYRADGQLDSSFGDDGQLTRPDIRQALIGPDLKLYVLWGDADRTLGRFNLDGTPDDGFGTDGQLRLEIPFDSGVGPAVDSQGRIYLVDYRTAIRLLPDGSPDPDFGPDGNGKVELDVDPAPPGSFFPLEVDRLEIGPDGNLYAFGRGNFDLYVHPSFVTGVDPSGNPLPGLPNLMQTEAIGSVSLFGNGVAYTMPADRFDPTPSFNVWATSWGGKVDAFFTDSESPAQVEGTTPLADGSLLAVGETSGRVCPPSGKCRSGSRAALLKVGGSGTIDSSFGQNGKVVIPGNECSWGKVDGRGDWDACRLRPPKIRGSVELGGARSSHPWLRIEAGLGPVPAKLGLGTQSLAFTLPGWLRVKNAGLLRKSVAAAMPGGKQKVEVRGRKLTVKVQQSKAIRIRIKLRPGAVKLKPGVRRLQGRKLQLRASFVPYDGSLDSPGRSAARLPVKVFSHRRR